MDFILTKDKNYNLKNELILQNENTQQKLKDYLQTLENNYQEMLTQGTNKLLSVNSDHQ